MSEATFKQLFSDESMWARIALDPQLKPHLSEPDFVEKVKALQADPNSLNE